MGLVSRLGWGIGLGMVLVAGCEPADPCADYVDYMCACHDLDTGVDCEALQATYASPGPAVQDECAVLLDEVEASDQDEGATCEA